LSGRKVLISAAGLAPTDIKPDLFPISITREQVRNSPDIDTDKPVSRQQEAMLNQHHFWENYWGSGSYGGEMGVANARPVKIKAIDRDPNEDIHLRSIAQVSGYAIHATDGEIGHVNDFIVDDQTWKLTGLVVDTHNWIGGKKVLVPMANVHTISFLSWLVHVNITLADINSCKLYKEAEYNQEA